MGSWFGCGFAAEGPGWVISAVMVVVVRMGDAGGGVSGMAIVLMKG
jgi:hypothetical protein